MTSSSSGGKHYTLPSHLYPPSSSASYPRQSHADPEDVDDDDDEQDLLAELDAVENQLVQWRKGLDWRWWCRWRAVPYYILAIAIGVVILLMTLYHTEILAWLRPAAEWMQALPAGWTIPIAILIIISFPPLFGHEIVAVLVGIIWGLWIGFGIVAAGTFLGEMANYVFFRYWFRGHAERLEQRDVAYACLAQAVRDGGFLITLVARLSAIPGHLSTPCFATCGMSAGVFALGALLSLPKQLITVYLGVALDTTSASTETKAIQTSVLVVTSLFTVGAAWWVWHKMKLARPAVVRARRRREKELRRELAEVAEAHKVEGGAPWAASVDSLAWVPNADSDQPYDLPRHSNSYSRRQQYPLGPNARYADPYQPLRSPSPPTSEEHDEREHVLPTSRAGPPSSSPLAHALEPSSTSSYHSAVTSAQHQTAEPRDHSLEALSDPPSHEAYPASSPLAPPVRKASAGSVAPSYTTFARLDGQAPSGGRF